MKTIQSPDPDIINAILKNIPNKNGVSNPEINKSIQDIGGISNSKDASSNNFLTHDLGVAGSGLKVNHTSADLENTLDAIGKKFRICSSPSEKKTMLDELRIAVADGKKLPDTVIKNLSNIRNDKDLGLKNLWGIKDILKAQLQNIKLNVQEKFYNKVGKLTKKARDDGDDKSVKAIEDLLDDKNLTKHVRTKANKSTPGAKRGNGEDEAFQTCETPEWINRSAGLVENKYPTSYRIDILGQKVEIDWMDMQQSVRHPTQFQIYKTGGGHSGALYEEKSPSKSGITNGQAEAHKIRNDEIIKSSTPKNATIRALKAKLKLTPNNQEFDQVITKGFDYKDRDLGNPIEKAEFKKEYLVERNQTKDDIRYVRNNLYNDDGASEVSDDQLSIDDDVSVVGLSV